MSKKPFWIVYSLLVLTTACTAQGIQPTHTLTINANIFHVAIAQDDQSRSQGLMNVGKLAKNQGMLFIFDLPRRLSFWMKNTPLPLSIAYINAQGEIKEIHDMTPFSEKAVPSRHAVPYALEVPQGTFQAKGIQVGDRVEGIPSLR